MAGLIYVAHSSMLRISFSLDSSQNLVVFVFKDCLPNLGGVESQCSFDLRFFLMASEIERVFMFIDYLYFIC